MIATVHELPKRPPGGPDDRSAQSGQVLEFPLAMVRLASESRAEWLLARQQWLAARARQRNERSE